jgi:hypothetical protein
MPHVIVTEQNIIGSDDLDEALELCRDAFWELNHNTVQRHLLTTQEYIDVFADRRIRKYVAYNERQQVLGLGTLTNVFDAAPLVSGAYFARHYYDYYHRGAVWVVGFVCADPHAPPGTFKELLGAMIDRIGSNQGMAVMDFASFNGRVRDVSEYLVKQINPTARRTALGCQRFYADEFDWEQS